MRDNLTFTISTEVCKHDDEYVRDLPRWVVELSNGETVYQDDNRPGLTEPSAWKRLKAYCDIHNCHIIKMWLQFRSNRLMLNPADASGYFFAKSAWGVWGEGVTHHCYTVGVVIEDQVYTTRFSVPDLTPRERQIRPLVLESPFIILRR